MSGRVYRLGTPGYYIHKIKVTETVPNGWTSSNWKKKLDDFHALIASRMEACNTHTRSHELKNLNHILKIVMGEIDIVVPTDCDINDLLDASFESNEKVLREALDVYVASNEYMRNWLNCKWHTEPLVKQARSSNQRLWMAYAILVLVSVGTAYCAFTGAKSVEKKVEWFSEWVSPPASDGRDLFTMSRNVKDSKNAVDDMKQMLETTERYAQDMGESFKAQGLVKGDVQQRDAKSPQQETMSKVLKTSEVVVPTGNAVWAVVQQSAATCKAVVSIDRSLGSVSASVEATRKELAQVGDSQTYLKAESDRMAKFITNLEDRVKVLEGHVKASENVRSADAVRSVLTYSLCVAVCCIMLEFRNPTFSEATISGKQYKFWKQEGIAKTLTWIVLWGFVLACFVGLCQDAAVFVTTAISGPIALLRLISRGFMLLMG